MRRGRLRWIGTPSFDGAAARPGDGVSNLLLETGDSLLQEDGASVLLLES